MSRTLIYIDSDDKTALETLRTAREQELGVPVRLVDELRLLIDARTREILAERASTAATSHKRKTSARS